MMVDNIALQVWLDTQQEMEHTIMVPYVKSAKDIQVDYSMSLITSGKSGKSGIKQSGRVDALATHAMPLSRMRIKLQQGDACQLKLVLRNQSEELGAWDFDCQSTKP
jgi:hypothetical protein